MAKAMTLRLAPGADTEWSLTSGSEILGQGTWDVWDVGAGLDMLVRFVHRSGRECKMVVARPKGEDLSTLTAIATIQRIASVYEAVTVRYA